MRRLKGLVRGEKEEKKRWMDRKREGDDEDKKGGRTRERGGEEARRDGCKEPSLLDYLAESRVDSIPISELVGFLLP